MSDKASVAWVGHLTEAPPGSQPRSRARASGAAAQDWTGVACLALVLATAFALAVAVLRLPGVTWGSMRAFRTALLLHVDLAIFAWLLTTAAAQWAATALAPRWPAALAAVATTALGASFLFGGEPVMADYLPWLAGNPVFAAAILGFAAAAAITASQALAAALMRREHPVWRGLGWSALPFLLAALAALGEIGRGVREVAEIAWVAGHVMLFGHVAVLCWEWPTLARRPVRRGPILACGGVAALLTVLPWLGLLDAEALRAAYTTAMRVLLWLPPLWVAVHLWRGDGDRAWWPSAALLLFGGLLGVFIAAPTTLVTAHYHAALGAVVVSRMAMTYRAARTLAGGDVPVNSAARQIAVYVTGLVLLAGGLALAAVDGAPRKTSAAATLHQGAAYRTGMAISGSGGVVALVGTVWLVLNLGGAARRRRETNNDDECRQ